MPRSVRCSFAICPTARTTSASLCTLHSRPENHSFTTHRVPSSATDKSSPSRFRIYWSVRHVFWFCRTFMICSSNSRRLTVPLYSRRSFNPWLVSQIHAPLPRRFDCTSSSYCSSTSVVLSFTTSPSCLYPAARLSISQKNVDSTFSRRATAADSYVNCNIHTIMQICTSDTQPATPNLWEGAYKYAYA